MFLSYVVDLGSGFANLKGARSQRLEGMTASGEVSDGVVA